MMGKPLDYIFLLGIFKNMEAIYISILRRLVDGFNIDPHSLWVVWIFWVIAVEKAHSLSHAEILLPFTHKALYLAEIHEADIVYMSVSLSV